MGHQRQRGDQGWRHRKKTEPAGVPEAGRAAIRETAAAAAGKARAEPAVGTAADAAVNKARDAPAAGTAAGRAEHRVPAELAEAPAGATDAIGDGTVKVYRNRSIDFLFLCGRDLEINLPVLSLRLEEKAIRRLERDPRADRFVEAVLEEAGQAMSVGVRYRGNHNRNYPKRSYDILSAGRIRHFNAEYNDPSMIRNALSFRFMNRIGVPAPRTRFCLLKVNGGPPGVYVELEAVDRDFFRERGMDVAMLAYAENDDAHLGLFYAGTRKRKASLFEGYRLVIGGEGERRRWESFIFLLNLLDGPNLETYLLRHLDVERYLRWLAGAVLTGNEDAFDHNYAVYRDAAGGKYAFVPWDYEGSWGRDCFGAKTPADAVRVTGYNRLTARLMGFSSFRRRYRELLAHILDEHFREEILVPVIREMLEEILPDLRRTDGNRRPVSSAPWELRVMARYIRARRKYVLDEIGRLS